MSLRYFALRLPRHAWRSLKGAAAKIRLGGDVADAVAPRGAPPPATLGERARRALLGGGARLPAGARRRVVNRLFYGNGVTTFALVGLTLSTRNGATEPPAADTKHQEEVLCYEIRDVVARYSWGYDAADANAAAAEDLTFERLEVGDYLAKGCSAVVYAARLKKDHDEVEEDDGPRRFPLALKIMFNYDIQSCSTAILSAMRRETVPARANRAKPHWANLFQSEIVELPPHPNVVAAYSAFADRMPDLGGGMELYPDALPSSLNPRGSGRNMTLFLLMKRYELSLKEYLGARSEPDARESTVLLAQLLEGVAHLYRHGVAHRDLKSDNLLVERVPVGGGGLRIPQLVISDFGCCLADPRFGLRLPYRTDAIDKGGNVSLMAPEILLERPGFMRVLDYSKADLWAAGAIAYEIFGAPNPFVEGPERLSGADPDYERRLPELTAAPPLVRRLVANLLARNPADRLAPESAADVCQLLLWAPVAWTDKTPTNREILEWLMCLTTKIVCEARLFDGYADGEAAAARSASPEYALIASFLSRVRLERVRDCLAWIRRNK